MADACPLETDKIRERWCVGTQRGDPVSTLRKALKLKIPKRSAGFLAWSFAALAAIALYACASAAPPQPVPVDPASAPTTAAMDPRIPSVANSDANQERLKALWEKRSARSETMDFPIGPGDVIEIEVPGVDDLKDRTVRVSGSGQIELPLIGIIDTTGQTETGLRDKLRGALGKYMYDPQVDVFVKEYHSRQVAVVGAVKSPGLVVLTGAGETILDVITQAGGMTPDAADEIVILPEVKGGTEKLRQIASSMAEGSSAKSGTEADSHAGTTQATQAGSTQGIVQASVPAADTVDLPTLERQVSNGPAVVIPLKSAMRGSAKYVNMPASPGDIIVVPGGGNVMVTGWVYKPGYFTVGSGLTVLGAVASAGGAMFAANSADATLIRSDGSGNKVSIPINLDKVSKGEDPDIPVRANDVIDVPYSDVKIGPYVFYNILTRVPLPTYGF
jgi:polysaccharide export outer membrane protein